MTKINFHLKSMRLPQSPSIGSMFETEYAQCDLALPAKELAAIANLLFHVPWIEGATEYEGNLYIKPIYDVSWAAQERAFHQVLTIARKIVAESINRLNAGSWPESKRPELSDSGAYCRRCHATIVEYEDNIGTFVSYEMPEGVYGPGFVVHKHKDGVLRGHFLTGTYEREKAVLAANLLNIINRNVETNVDQRRGFEILVKQDSQELQDCATACMQEAYAIIQQIKSQVEALEHKGDPSVFTTEDNDARDILVDMVMRGAKIEREYQDSSSDYSGDIVYTIGDENLPEHIVQRLINANIVEVDDWRLESRKPDEPLRPLVFNPKEKAGQRDERRSTVRFKAFESYCRYRRYDSDAECAHKDSGYSQICKSGSCPILTPIYKNDVGRYGNMFDNDPAFNDNDYEHDPLMRADSPNTEKSYAWKAAGENAVHAVINQVLHSHYKLGVGRHLFGYEHKNAMNKAKELDYLELEEMPGLGIVASPTENLIKIFEAQRQALTQTRKQENTL